MNNLKFNPFQGIDINVDVNKSSPTLMMVIGLLLVVYGLYQYLNKEKNQTTAK